MHLLTTAKANTKKSLIAVGLLALTCSGCTPSKAPNTFEQILENIYKMETENIDIHSIDKMTDSYLTLIDDHGAFTDINYTDHAQTAWEPLNHVTRLKTMVVSYITPSSQFYKNSQLYTNIVKMFSHWYETNPTSTNWWFHEIGWAQQMGLSLSLMRAGDQLVPDSLEHLILERMKTVSKGPDQPGSQGTGANKMDIALQWIYRTCLQEDKTNLEFAINQFFYPIQFNSGQGIQSDYSYLQHGQQLYTGGYGASVLDAFLRVAFYIENTPYVNEEKNKLMSDFVRLGNIPFVRGKNMLFNAQGRGVARINNSDRSSLAGGFSKLMVLDETHGETYKACIKRLQGTATADYGIVPFHQHYWRGDYTIHQRPTYTMDVRTASTRTARCENGNGENLLGYFLTEGSTGIVRHGNEYNNIFPSWDWTHIPGTTTPSVKQIPLPEQWEHKGQSTFTGGVTDGIYGVSTYQMKDKEFGINSSAKKSWFFFDKEIVCMGSDIQSSNASPIHTTINQCLLNGKITYLTNNTEEIAKDTEDMFPLSQNKTFSNLLCVTHDSISYVFPEGGKLHLSNETQTGSWKDLCQHQSANPVSQSIFKLWFDHGHRPSKGKYIYYVMPGTESPSKAINTLDSLLTMNNEKFQAVYNHNLHILGVVFHQPGSIDFAGFNIKSSTPCVVMFTHLNTDTIKAYIADPSYKLTETVLSIQTPRQKKASDIVCKFKTDVHYAGSTHTLEIENK